VRRLVLVLLVAGYAAVFAPRPSRDGAHGFDPLEPRGRHVERLIEESNFTAALPLADELWSARHDSPTIAFWRAEIFHGLGRPAEEAGAWEDVLRLGLPDGACPNLALAYQAAGDRHRALDAYQRCAAAAPDDPERWLDLGFALKAANRPADASEAFQRAVALDPTHPRIPHDLTGRSETRHALLPAGEQP
jgi:tetratricopeptide (TPR) repeat protein